MSERGFRNNFMASRILLTRSSSKGSGDISRACGSFLRDLLGLPWLNFLGRFLLKSLSEPDSSESDSTEPFGVAPLDILTLAQCVEQQSAKSSST